MDARNELQPGVLSDPDGVIVCGVIGPLADVLAKWPGANPDLPWHLNTSGYRGTIPVDRIVQAYALAWSYWAEAVEINPRMIATVSGAKVWATFQRIDGPSNTLAWSMLANNSNSPKEQRYDAGDTWVITPAGSVPTGGIDLVRVAAHEIGHVLGLPHDASNANALMRPSYSTSIPKPLARDIDRLVSLGYARRTTPIPPPVPPVPSPTDPPPVEPRPRLIVIDTATKSIRVPRDWDVSN